MNQPRFQFAVIADDLTGALDTGLQFRKKGFRTLVPLRPNPPWPNAEALVLNTESRNIPGPQAYRKVFEVCRPLKAKAIYKKIDSTMRGNVGREVEAILKARGIPKAIVVPSIPILGRTVEKGILKVNGIPLLQTPYARDPFHPLSSSRVAQILSLETSLSVGHISLAQVHKGPKSLAARIHNGKERIFSIDAVTEEDLKCIGSAWELLGGEVLPCGSVGLANEIPPRAEETQKPKKKNSKPILIVSASLNPRTAEQIERVRAHYPFPLIEPQILRLTHPRHFQAEANRLMGEITKGWVRTKGAILTTTFLEHRPGIEKRISRNLGRVALKLLQRASCGALVLTGGDLAMGVCRALSTSALEIQEEVLPGIPCSKLVGGPFDGLRLVTKAGGFGEPDALSLIVQYLRGNHEEEEAT